MRTKDDALIEKMLNAFYSDHRNTNMPRALAVARREILEEAAGAIERLIDTDKIRRECCGRGIPSGYSEPPECCGDPDLLVTIDDAASAIRSLSTQEQKDD
jgi:hypothetical protein